MPVKVAKVKTKKGKTLYTVAAVIERGGKIIALSYRGRFNSRLEAEKKKEQVESEMKKVLEV